MEKNYKRTSRSMGQDVKAKISNSLKGRSKPESTKEKISQGMKKYWGNDANFPDDFGYEGTGWIESGDVV